MPEITPEEYADFRKMRAEWKRYGIKKGVIAPLTLVEAIDGQKIGVDSGAMSGELCDWDTTGLVGSSAGTPTGGASQWLGDGIKGIYEGHLHVGGGTEWTYVPTNPDFSMNLVTTTIDVEPTALNPTDIENSALWTWGTGSTNEYVGSSRYFESHLVKHKFNSGYLFNLGPLYTAWLPQLNYTVPLTVTALFGNQASGSQARHIICNSTGTDPWRSVPDTPNYCVLEAAPGYFGRLYVGGSFTVEPGMTFKTRGGIVYEVTGTPAPVPPPTTHEIVTSPPPFTIPIAPPPPTYQPPPIPPPPLAYTPPTPAQVYGAGNLIAKADSDVQVAKARGRLIVFSPNGSAWEIKVSDLGAVTASAVTTTPLEG